MEENKQEQKKIQQNLLNYVSHNLTKKNEKPKEKERSDSKSSTGRETKTSTDKAGTTNVTSGPKQQRPRTGVSASENNTQGTTSSNSRQSTQGGSTRGGTTKTTTPTSNQTPKTWTPPSIKRSNPPPKKLNMEMNASQTCNSPRIDDITRRNVSQVKDTIKSGTRSNSSTMETTITPRQNTNESLSEGEVNETASADIKIDNNAVINPYEDEMDTDETLEDLGPELAKMG